MELKNCPSLNDVSNVFIGLTEGTGISSKLNFLEGSLAVIQVPHLEGRDYFDQPFSKPQ
jgi:hypothetical protein